MSHPDQTSDQIDFQAILASSVHDMKNSLAMVLGTLDAVLEETQDECPALQSKAGQLQYEAMRVNANLVQLLTIYKLESKQYEPQTSEVLAEDFIEESYLRDLPLFQFNNIEAEIDCEEELYWSFDTTLVQGLLDNVINNSLRYTKDRLKISAEEADGFLKISVQDNGSGYPKAMLTNSKKQNTKVDFTNGHTGLGLYFAELIAHSHESQGRSGYIEISNNSDLGGGCFSLYLP